MSASGKVRIGGGPYDPHARYVRSRLVLKFEGAGNGLKTVLSNLEDIAKELYVQPECTFV